MVAAPPLVDAEVTVRLVRVRDARAIEALLRENRDWLAQWEATYPSQTASVMPTLGDVRASIRALLAQAKLGSLLPMVIEVDDRLVGQLNVSNIVRGSMSTAVIGYWIAQSAAGRAVTPRAVALVADFCFSQLGLHRLEICLRPTNAPSKRVVEKLGFRFEGLRRRYIHINGAWADHICFALLAEDAPDGVLTRYRTGAFPADISVVPDYVISQLGHPI